MIAAVGTDGRRPVVWGMGATEEEALVDARTHLEAGDCESYLECHAITEAQAEVVRAGDVSWPVVTP